MPNPMTVKGAEDLREEVAYRKGALRQEISEAIAEARAHGDLKENAEYHAAREQQSFNEGRIQEIESRLADAQIIDVSKIDFVELLQKNWLIVVHPTIRRTTGCVIRVQVALGTIQFNKSQQFCTKAFVINL